MGSESEKVKVERIKKERKIERVRQLMDEIKVADDK